MSVKFVCGKRKWKLIIVVVCVRSAVLFGIPVKRKRLAVKCMSCSCHSKPVLNVQPLRWEWFCSICITSFRLTVLEWENIHCFKEYKQWLLMFYSCLLSTPLSTLYNHTHSHMLVTKQWWFRGNLRHLSFLSSHGVCVLCCTCVRYVLFKQ